MKRKPKLNEPSLRDKLSQKFFEDFVSEFRTTGMPAINAMREKNLQKYCEIGARLIATIEPQADGFKSAKSREEIALRLLLQAGVPEDQINDTMIEAAKAANDAFVNRLDEIAAEAIQRQNELN